MRWLIVGPYPPSVDPAALVTRSVVAERLGAGDEAYVVSPEPSAAHEAVPLAGAAALVRVLVRGRGYDGVWVHIGPGIGPSPHPGRARALAERLVLAVALRALDAVTVHVGRCRPVPRWPGGPARAPLGCDVRGGRRG